MSKFIPVEQTAICQDEECGEPFTYVRSGSRPQIFCPTCKIRRNKAAAAAGSKASTTRLKLGPNEVQDYTPGRGSSCKQISLSETAAKLALWEGLDIILAGGDDNVEVKALTHQRIQQIERKVLKKLQRELGPYYTAFRAELNAA